MVCTFFGHSNAPSDIEKDLRRLLADLIEQEKVDRFYVGNNGNFDWLECKILSDLKKIYPHIEYSMVLAYMPTKRKEYDDFDYSVSEYPDILTKVPKRFAINRRNEYMISKSDYVVTYVVRPIGCAVKYKRISEQKGKRSLT